MMDDDEVGEMGRGDCRRDRRSRLRFPDYASNITKRSDLSWKKWMLSISIARGSLRESIAGDFEKRQLMRFSSCPSSSLRDAQRSVRYARIGLLLL
jgi:hypothetical protein